jgi:ADP-ribose pyrophosphatase
MATTYTHPDVLTRGVREGWADQETDPARIDWAPRQAAAAIPFRVVDGRPLNPCRDHYSTGIRYGRGQLGHWGEQLCVDAVVTAADPGGHRWLLMIERGDGHGWALPGGKVDPGETPARAAVRELAEETGLAADGASFDALPARYVPDPRASDEAWMVTVPFQTHLGTLTHGLPAVVGADDARRAAWVRANTCTDLVTYLAGTHGGRVFAAHRPLLAELLG